MKCKVWLCVIWPLVNLSRDLNGFVVALNYETGSGKVG